MTATLNTVNMDNTASDLKRNQDEDQLITRRYRELVQPFWQSHVSQGQYTGLNGVPIHYAMAKPANARQTVMISSGRIETLLKYKELVFNLYHAGYQVFIHDHRGQGLSGRMADNPHLGYVESFDHYVHDMKLFYDNVIMRHSDQKPLMLCHSMGGAIGALYALTYPTDIARIALSAPMFGIQPALPGWLASLLLSSQSIWRSRLTPTPYYFYGQKDYFDEPFDDNPLTHSKARYTLLRQEYLDTPQAQLGGVTNQWLRQALIAMDTIARRAQEITIPVLLMQAGADPIVDNAAQDRVASQLIDCRKHTFDDALHEILMENDAIRDNCLRLTLAFFDKAQNQR